MRIIHGSHCLPKFSLAYRKQKLHTSWFSITFINKETTNEKCVISILEKTKQNMSLYILLSKRQHRNKTYRD